MSTTAAMVERLQVLGMSGYEAKAYLALVTAGEPLNGYEIAKRSGVPRSTVYETLSKLTASGATYELSSSEGAVTYLPLPPKSLLDRLSRRYETTLTSLREDLSDIAAPPRLHLIHNMTGRSMLLERAGDVVAASTRELFVSAWPQEHEVLATLVQAAEKRGVAVTMMTFGPTSGPEVGHTYQHTLSMPEIVLENLGCRLFTVAADRSETVIGGFDGDDAWGVYTDNPAVVLLSVEYIRHDIAIQLIGKHFTDDEVMRFWQQDPDMIRLRSDHGRAAAALRARS